MCRNEDSFCSHCWSNVLTTTRGWRRALLYLPLSCILAWRPNRLWLSYIAGKKTQALLSRFMTLCAFSDTYTYMVCSRSVGGVVLATYCIERTRTTRSLPIERRDRFGRRESLEHQTGQLRSLRGSPSEYPQDLCIRCRVRLILEEICSLVIQVW